VGDMSSVFHVFSLLAFIVLSYAVLRLQAQLKLWRDWNSALSSQKVTVGAPIHELRRFALAIGASFESDLPDNGLPVTKLKLDACFNLHRTCRIAKILVTKTENARVDFVLGRQASIMPVDLNQLRHELGDGIEVAVMTDHRP